MIAVDTNVLIRFLVRDDAGQGARAAALVRDNDVWVSKTVILETEWVLRSLYGFPSESVMTALRKLVGLRTMFLEDEAAVAKALAWSGEGLDFADALHLASAGNSKRFATFDRKLARQANRVAGLETVSI
ncbi:MAG TPA: type II toxin-antitoxin system VapC family toxin [Terriglobia bacterium]|nr:type II toxin-antitoxin system VapC family toxin [Terriglobia bacterium]